MAYQIIVRSVMLYTGPYPVRDIIAVVWYQPAAPKFYLSPVRRFERTGDQLRGRRAAVPSGRTARDHGEAGRCGGLHPLYRPAGSEDRAAAEKHFGPV